ncbi:MAG: hypothetical protein ACRDQD_27275 [Nocardioidaceae bacterium]
MSPDSRPWRTSRSWGRTIVIQAGDEPGDGVDELVGMARSPEVAGQAVRAVNTGEPVSGARWAARSRLIVASPADLYSAAARWIIAMDTASDARRVVDAVNGQAADA